MKVITVILFTLFSVGAFAAPSKNAPSNTEKSTDFVLVKGGTFNMGSPANEDWRGNDETLHKVTVSDFQIAKFEVTQKFYREVMGENPSSFKGDNLPVENVTWLDAVRLCNKLSEREKRKPVYEISDDGKTVSWNREAYGFDMVELKLVKPYSDDYNTVLNEAQRDQHKQARPALKTKIQNFAQYETIIIGYPNWWASIPMPIATLLESYDFTGKRILPFCSHGGGRFGQSITAIAKLAPNAKIGEGLSVHYSGGSSLKKDVAEWLKKNGMK